MSAPPAPPNRVSSGAAPSGAAPRLRALGGNAIAVRGPRTGWRYEFPLHAPVQAVAEQDAELLLASGLFTLER